MKISTYKITAPDKKGMAFAMYENYTLRMFINEFEQGHLTAEAICEDEAQLQHVQGYFITQLKPKTVAEKVAMFCMLYKQHKAVAYRATREEKANLKLVTVNEQLLNTYFTHTAYPLTHTKTMADYVRHYNTVRDLATNGTPQKKSGFPDVYDHGYERTISDDVSKLQRYWEHLRNLGWRKVDGVWLQNSQITTRKS